METCGSQYSKVGISYWPSTLNCSFVYLEVLSFCSDHKRLDYLLEHQVLTTSSETHDVEVYIYRLCDVSIGSVLGSDTILMNSVQITIFDFISSSGVSDTWCWTDGSYGSSLHILWFCRVYMESHKFPAVSEYQYIWCISLETLHHGQKGMRQNRNVLRSTN